MAEPRLVEPAGLRIVAEGLSFPEGPVALLDGSVLLVEIASGLLTRIDSDGSVDRVAHCGGGPNGAALGSDGAVYVANNGGAVSFLRRDGRWRPSHDSSPSWLGHGSIQRVDLASGRVESLYESCDGRPLKAPNDLVVAADGGIWFTDFGRVHDRSIERGGVYWCRPDGSEIREVIVPLDQPNGIGLSPPGDKLYVAETNAGRLWSWKAESVGGVTAPATTRTARLLADPGHLTRFDSLAVDGEGWVCVARLSKGAIVAVSPNGQDHGLEVLPMPDPFTTNLCFGPDGRTTYVTLSSSGRLAAFHWHRLGGRPAFWV